MHTYLVYGLKLASELPLPELLSTTAADASDDDVVRLAAGSVDVEPPPGGGMTSFVQVLPERREVLCAYEGVGRFRVREGREITVDALPGVDAGLVRHLLIGPVMGQLLWQRGLFTLHASVVRIGERHAAFVGVSGEGKSTTAAALDAAGHTLVCDDIAAIPWAVLPIRALPGFPRIRLYPDSLRGVGGDPEAHPLIHDQIDKRLARPQTFAAEPAVLDRLYVLESGPELKATPLARREAMIELLKHSYNASQLAPIVGFQRHMQMAGRVAEHVPAFRLARPKDLARLSELVRFLEAHVEA